MHLSANTTCAIRKECLGEKHGQLRRGRARDIQAKTHLTYGMLGDTASIVRYSRPWCERLKRSAATPGSPPAHKSREELSTVCVLTEIRASGALKARSYRCYCRVTDGFGPLYRLVNSHKIISKILRIRTGVRDHVTHPSHHATHGSRVTLTASAHARTAHASRRATGTLGHIKRAFDLHSIYFTAFIICT